MSFRLPDIKNSSNFSSNLVKYISAIFVALSVLAIFVPLNPHMPASGLDPSWQFSMNEAVAQHLILGKEIIFTFGPYASIYTQLYHPETDALMLLGSVYIGVFYVIALLFLGGGRKKALLISLVIFLEGFLFLRDPLLFSYPLVIAASSYVFLVRLTENNVRGKNMWLLSFVFLMLSPLGLLPLIKGSLLLVCALTAVMISLYFLYNRYYYLAAVVVISPIVSSVVFWSISGQSLSNFSGFFAGLVPIITGYTEAMAIQGKTVEIYRYLISASFIVGALVTVNKITVSSRVFLGICFSLFLFIAFKSGFVRHDGHAMIAGISLVVAAFVASLICSCKRVKFALFLSVIAWFSITKNYVGVNADNIISNIENTYSKVWQAGMLDREYLQDQFKNSLLAIREEYSVPDLHGTSDVYSYDQSYLLASGNKWNPRPVFQSYQVYTQSLAVINEAHLRGENAPDNILIRVQPIDGRMPSLEDGLSWPALFDNYTVERLDNEFAYLQKKETVKRHSDFDVIYDGINVTGEHVQLPESKYPVYAQIDLKPTLLGKLLGLVFKPPQLKLTLKLKDGRMVEYRTISGMMRSGFFISPLVKSTEDFVFLAEMNRHYLESAMVESMAVSPVYGGAAFWMDTYTLKIKGYRGEPPLSSLLGNLKNNIVDSVPIGYAESEPVDCEGAIDVVNGWNPAPASVKVAGMLSVSGWLGLSMKDGLVPDDVFVTLKKKGEATKYIKANRTPRNDVKAYFKQLSMSDVGYSITADVSKLNGQYTLGLYRGYKGKIMQCQIFKMLIIGSVENIKSQAY